MCTTTASGKNGEYRPMRVCQGELGQHGTHQIAQIIIPGATGRTRLRRIKTGRSFTQISKSGVYIKRQGRAPQGRDRHRTGGHCGKGSREWHATSEAQKNVSFLSHMGTVIYKKSVQTRTELISGAVLSARWRSCPAVNSLLESHRLLLCGSVGAADQRYHFGLRGRSAAKWPLWVSTVNTTLRSRCTNTLPNGSPRARVSVYITL